MKSALGGLMLVAGLAMMGLGAKEVVGGGEEAAGGEKPPPLPAPPACTEALADAENPTAAQAWHMCQWNAAFALYGAAPSRCAQELRLAPGMPYQKDLAEIEATLPPTETKTPKFHKSLVRLEALGFKPSEQCLGGLKAGEAEEQRLINLEVTESEKRMRKDIVDGKFITNAAFQPLKDGWTWDIQVSGNWAFFQQATADDRASWIAFAAVAAYVGEMSSQTHWSSRYLRFADAGGACQSRMSTRDARKAARDLKAAFNTEDQNAAVQAVVWVQSRLSGC